MKTAHILYKQAVTTVSNMLQCPEDYYGVPLVNYYYRSQTPYEFRGMIQRHLVQMRPRDFQNFKFYWLEKKFETEWV